MDPVSLIVTALVAGASAAVKETAGAAVRDAYQSLKGLLQRKLAERRDAQAVVQEPSDASAEARGTLERELREARAGEDDELLRAARRLLALTDPTGTRAGKYDVTVSGGQGVVVGDDATVTMNFRDS